MRATLTPAFKPLDPAFESRVTNSFKLQNVMALIGARLDAVEAGHCTISLPWREDLGQHNGFFHAGITSTIADSAGGYAGFTLMPAGSNVLTAEFKVSLLRPAAGIGLVAHGEVIKPGRSLCFTEVKVYAQKDDGQEVLCARMSQTLACVDASTT